MATGMAQKRKSARTGREIPKKGNTQRRSSGRARNRTIKQCIPVVGDWYRLEIDPSGDECFIDRIVLWALMAGSSRTIDHVEGIDGFGVPSDDISEGHVRCVFGSDRSPSGKTWNEVYESTEPNVLGARRIKDFRKESWQS